MRREIPAALAETLNKRQAQLPIRPSEVDNSDQLAEMMRKIESNNAAKKTVIRLAGISKEGNKQHFMDMVEIQEEIDKAIFSIKEPPQMHVEDVALAKEALERAPKLIEESMSLIERVDIQILFLGPCHPK